MEPLTYDVKNLPFSATQLKQAVESYPTPFHIYNEQAIRENAVEFQKQFQNFFPSFKNYFAVKATPNPHIMKILKSAGMGADCSSMAELILSEKVGLVGEDIMFTSNDTPADEYVKAHQLGAIINIDDITHIDFVKKQLGKLPDLMCLRYNPGPLKQGNVIIGEPTEAKFGLTREQVKEAYTRMKAEGVKRFGLHCMVASNELKVEYFGDTAKVLFELVLELHKELGVKIEFVNLGGGVGIPYRPTQQRIEFAQLAKHIDSFYQDIIIKNGLGPLRIVTECGRVMTGPYGALVVRAVHQKKTYKNYVGVDGCMANLMRPGMYGSYHHISVYDKDWKLKVGKTQPVSADTHPCELLTYDVTGSLCENNDKFAVNRVLPQVETGDILVIHDAGAHGHSMGFNYNGKLRSAEYLVKDDNSIVQIRRAETYDDLFATLSF
jgi:diaminopimelate decarboxylase